MNNLPKIRAIVLMPDGQKIEVIEYQIRRFVYNLPNKAEYEAAFGLRNKATLELIGSPNDSLTRAFGELYGRIKAQENKIKANKVCSHCGR